MGFGTFIVIIALIILVGICVRNIYKEHKSGGCGSCKGCGGGSCNSCGGGEEIPQDITITIKRKKEI